jgi:hypothetical protein
MPTVPPRLSLFLACLGFLACHAQTSKSAPPKVEVDAAVAPDAPAPPDALGDRPPLPDAIIDAPPSDAPVLPDGAPPDEPAPDVAFDLGPDLAIDVGVDVAVDAPLPPDGLPEGFPIIGVDGGRDRFVSRDGLPPAGPAPQACKTMSWLPPIKVKVGGGPRSLVVAHLDGDDLDDLAVANEDDGTITVLLRDPAGAPGAIAWKPPLTLTAGTRPFSLVAADLDRDGRMDLAVANRGLENVSVFQDSVMVFWGQPGGFSAPTRIDGFTRPVGIAAGRLEGDDDLLDLAVTNDGTGSADWIQQDPAHPRQFSPPTNFTGLSQATFHFHDIAIGDFTADGLNDIAIALDLGSDGAVQTNDQDQTTSHDFNTTQWWDAGNRPQHVLFADINGDGLQDIVESDWHPNATLGGVLAVHYRDPWKPKKFSNLTFLSTAPAGRGSLWVDAGDLNRDGFQDLVAVNDGLNGLSVIVQDQPAYPPKFLPATTVAAGGDPSAVVIADLDGDGRPDLAVSNHADGDVWILRQRCDALDPYDAGLPVDAWVLPDAEVRRVAYQGCAQAGNTCSACATGGTAAAAWSLCTAACYPNEDNCAQATTGNVAVHCVRDFWGRPGCAMPCQGGDICPDGLRCLPDMQGKTWCVAPGFAETDARTHLSAEAAPTQPVVPVNAPAPRLCGSLTYQGTLSASDPTYHHSQFNCVVPSMLSYYVDLYAFELVGPGPHDLDLDLCQQSEFYSRLEVYQNAGGTPRVFDLAKSCSNLVASGLPGNSCYGESARVKVVGLVPGTVTVAVTSNFSLRTGGYTLHASSSTSCK